MSSGGDEVRPAGAFYGRRRGKRLRQAQAERVETGLPALRVPADGPIDLQALFGPGFGTYRLEIGFGGGEHLAAEAAREPATGFIGAEAFVNGVAKLVAEIEDRNLRNIRVHDADASQLLPRLPAGAFARIDLLYPDPWPKRRQRKRRFVSDERLGEIARLLKPGGLFRFATDIDDYAAWTLMHAARRTDLVWTASRADDWRVPWDGWTRTRYEAKAVREGRAPTYLTFVRP